MSQYSDILQLLARKKAGSPGVQTGTVRTVSPLTLYIGGTVITRGILAPPLLLQKPPENESISAPMAAYLQDVQLKPGDTVAVQRHGDVNMILCKVVSV